MEPLADDARNFKVCFLFLVHSQPDQLARLLETLQVTWATSIIHVDAHAPLPSFLQATKHLRNVHFLQKAKRVKVCWGGYSVVEATLNLLDEAVKAFPNAQRFCLLSGADYPIKDHTIMEHTLLQNEREYLSADLRIDNDPGVYHHRHVAYSHFLDTSIARHRIAGKIIRRLRVRRKVLQDIPLYKGSQWFAVSRQVVQFILDFVKQTPSFVAFHRRTFAPDEIFFQSIVKAGSFQISHAGRGTDEDREEHVCGVHFIDWTTNAAIKAGPMIFTETDFDRLVASSALFARKMCPNASASLLDRLDRQLHLR